MNALATQALTVLFLAMIVLLTLTAWVRFAAWCV